MKIIPRLLLVLTGAFLLTAQQSQELDGKLAGKMAAALQQSGTPSVSIAVVRNGKLVYAKAGAFDIDSFNAIIIPLLKEPIPEAPPQVAAVGK